MFKLQDNLSNEKVTFESKEITAYVCGPTVYDHPHIGNLRPIITYDIMFRILNYQGIKVNFLHNITDIDDKIIEKAINENKSESEITNFYTDEYLKLLDTLNVVSISKVVKVSDSITGIQSFVSEMIEKDIAYEIDGNVFFDLEKSKDYGKLSNRTLSEKDFENEFTNLKRNPKDFVLWKNTDKGVQFDSPWGKGRPGWHTECVHFIDDYFHGNTIDIHGGGIDLKFPHHENEIAQFETLKEKPLSNVWSYVGHLTLDNIKMSKSLGNVFLAKDFITEYGPNVLRALMLSTHYSKPMNVTQDLIDMTIKELNKWFNAIENAEVKEINEEKVSTELVNEFIETISNDFKLANAKDFFNKISKKINNTENEEKIVLANTLLKILSIIGIIK